MRRVVSRTLVEFGERATAAVPALIDALKNDDDHDVRNNAAWALGRMGEPAAEAVPALINALSDSHPWVRHQAPWALG